LDVGSELSEARIDLTGTTIPPVRQVERVLKVFRELKRSSRAACETAFRLRSERWPTYAYCNTHCNWLIDTIPNLQMCVDAIIDDLIQERNEAGGKRSRDFDEEHFVYLYRHKDGRPIYVGYGKDPSRAIFHVSGSHNERLNTYLEAGEYDLSIAGPFCSEEIGRTVETVLISTLQPECNIDPGPSLWRFRPIGVPGTFVHRPGLLPLTREDLILVMEEMGYAAILFVYLNDREFGDGRLGYDIANPPPDDVVYDRMKAWWHVGRYVPGWIADPSTGPGLLTAVTGLYKHRLIVGSMEIDRTGWTSAPCNEYMISQFTVPTLLTLGLDACKLRGRRIAAEAELKFNSIGPEMFLLLNRNGSVIGGRSQK
jgi:hypothetical protein